MAQAVILKEMLVCRALTNRKRPPHRDLASVKHADLWEVAIGEKQNFRRMTFLRFNRLYVIKSLAADEVPTGTILFEYLQPVIDAAACTLPMGLYKCHDAQGFRDIAAEVLVNSLEGHLPWIHIECHGSDDGLIFANGSEIGWPALCDLLRPINQACGFQLFVALACFMAAES